MKIQFLIDNITKNELLAEWGLSVYIEYEGHIFLLDAGTTGRFADNAKEMGIDLSKVEYGVLSHAHYDHADGLERFFMENTKAQVYLREGTKENCYDKKKFFAKYIGIHKGYLKKYADRFIFAKGDQEIAPGVYLIPHKTEGLSEIGKKASMYRREGFKWYPDDFSHEQSLVFDTEKGLVIFNSCSHGGADNIIKEVSATFPDKKIYLLAGGFHLYHSTEAEVRALAARIRDTGIEKILTGHCTGEKAFGFLKEELGEKIEQIYTGLTLEI